MARFTNPSTWGRSKSTKDLNAQTHTPPSSNVSYSSSKYGSPMTANHHPYASNPPAPVPIVASHDATEDEEDCPVCLESLSFSFRLPGEKPHIVPECGHALHEACFTAVYGPVPNPVKMGGLPRKNLGVCGVCRRPMKVGEGDSKSNKLAALTGMGATNDKYPGPGVSPPPGSVSRPGVVVGPNIRPGQRPGATTPSHGAQSNGSAGVVVIGGVAYVPPQSSSSPSTSAPRPSLAHANLIDAHPTAATYASPPTPPPQKPFDPTEDDPLDHNPSIRSGSSDPQSSNANYIVAPSIQVRSEFATITPNANVNPQAGNPPTQPLTCIVVVELPSRRTGPPPSTGPSPVVDPYALTGPTNPGAASLISATNASSLRHVRGTIPEDSIDETNYSARYGNTHSRDPSTVSKVMRYPGPTSPPPSGPVVTSSGISVTSTPSALPPTPNPEFEAIALDLQRRISDWKGHPMSGLGPLQMFDVLSVRRDSLVREFFVYLFKEAIICVLEDKKSKISVPESHDGIDTGGAVPKGVLRLKGRIYIRHIKRVNDSSTVDEDGEGELSLTIDMEDERLESFILVFKDRETLDNWRNCIASLVDSSHGITPSNTTSTVSGNGSRLGVGARADGRKSPGPGTTRSLASRTTLGDMDEFGQNTHHGPPPAKSTGMGLHRERMMSGSTSTTNSMSGVSAGYRGTVSSAATSTGTGGGGSFYAGKGGNDRDRETPTPTASLPPAYAPPAYLNQQLPTPMPHAAASTPSNNLPPLAHIALDLILVISLPPPTSTQSTAYLKLKVIKTTLDFVIANLGTKDRLSIVTFQVGVGGKVRKTPFLRLGRSLGKERLARFVDSITFGGENTNGNGGDDEKSVGSGGAGEDEFAVRTGKDEKTDVVTGVNHALDTVLQRKQRNPISGMILVSDASDSTRRAQMDLVLARAEAANLPIHSFGYGRSHDPASLWLMSNHTNGTYTFVKDWYDLRSCLAGCVGGMMSIGLTNMKLHMKIVDNHRFRIRKVSGGPHAIVSSDGHNVDVEIGEVRYGEKKEMLVELELDYWSSGSNNKRSDSESLLTAGGNATDEFVKRMGLDALSIGDTPNLVEGMMDRMIDEVPVFEVDGSFMDPASAKQVSRLAHPVLLTVTILPPPSTPGRPSTPNPNADKPSDPVIVRRRMELLASDMITRALVLISRKNFEQATRIMSETKRILHTVLQNIGSHLSIPTSGTIRSRKEMLTLSAIRALQAVLQDIQVLTDAMEDNVEMFAHDHRNLGAQQAMILRDQKSWSGRTATEKLFWTADSSIDLASRSTDWVANRE
ncbi:hypothetical protein FRC03_002803 [Tulasnella sp. 419]|nr:hypothetical protein FRC03_002803 [Tulasnella sp. 419]